MRISAGVLSVAYVTMPGYLIFMCKEAMTTALNCLSEHPTGGDPNSDNLVLFLVIQDNIPFKKNIQNFLLL